MTWVLGLSVAALIALGAPIFVALLAGASLVLLLFPGPPLIAATDDLRRARRLCAAVGAVLRLCRR
ncbi:MAG: hypothetical protein R3D59_08000 [Paracoccaceae bacterium]